MRGDWAAVLEAEELRAFDEVLDLAPVELELRQPLQRVLVEVEALPARALDEVLPNAVPRGAVEVRVRQQQVDPRPEGVVDAGHAVGGEEDGALVVLELGQEDWADTASLARVFPGTQKRGGGKGGSY